MRLIDADRLCTELLERWNTAEIKKEELIKAVMADIVTPIVVSQPTIEPHILCEDCTHHESDEENNYEYCTAWRRETHGDWSCSRGKGVGS